MSDMTERYEAEAEAFYKATGVMAPGKDSPAAMGGYDADELRHKLWRMWARAVYAERERDEARREREEWETMVGTQRLVLEGLHRRAERAERVVEAANAIYDARNETEDWDARSRLMDALKEYLALDAAEGSDA